MWVKGIAKLPIPRRFGVLVYQPHSRSAQYPDRTFRIILADKVLNVSYGLEHQGDDEIFFTSFFARPTFPAPFTGKSNRLSLFSW
jgi:hypothetical protein